MQSTYCSAASQIIETHEKLWVAVSRCSRQWEVCFCACGRWGRRGQRVLLATHATKRNHRLCEPLPGQLALSWWQWRLSRNQSQPCLPAAPFHRFMDACVYVCAGKSLFLPDLSLPRFACVCVHMCIKYHAEADLIFPRITNGKQRICETSPSVGENRWRRRARVSGANDADQI